MLVGLQIRTLERGRRARNHQQTLVVPVQSHLLEKHHLVREHVGRVAVDVVERAQFVVEETRRARRRNDPRGADLLDVLTRTIHLSLTLLDTEVSLRTRDHVVDHRVPDRARILQHVDVDGTELLGHHVQVHRPRVVHVERDGLPVGHHQAGVADRAVGRRAERDDHDVEITLGPGQRVLDRVGGLVELVEAELLQLVLEIEHRVVRQQHRRVLVDVFGQVLRIEVVLVQVRDVEVIAITQLVPVQARVVGEREPRRVEGRVHPRIAQDAPRLGPNMESRVPHAGDLH
ncbi:unannotated protein [freshwater metagenome]|uniref:Unannotated protein n=1 Tax=freshwater metagenome TaxID=449393 RepID=A0A6J7HHR9_9ZZZZ